jgi:hypothetical protein
MDVLEVGINLLQAGNDVVVRRLGVVGPGGNERRRADLAPGSRRRRGSPATLPRWNGDRRTALRGAEPCREARQRLSRSPTCSQAEANRRTSTHTVADGPQLVEELGQPHVPKSVWHCARTHGSLPIRLTTRRAAKRHNRFFSRLWSRLSAVLTTSNAVAAVCGLR